MSTTRTTTQTAQFNQPSMGVFGSFQPTIQAGLMDYATNPLTATYFNQQVAQANRYGANLASTANQALFRNQRAFGNLNNPGAFMASELARNQRAAMSRQAQTFNTLLMNANQVRMQALGQMQGYRPLQIGQTSKESTGGLGSWLSPLLSAGIGAASMAFGSGGGGASSGNPFMGQTYYGGGPGGMS